MFVYMMGLNNYIQMNNDLEKILSEDLTMSVLFLQKTSMIDESLSQLANFKDLYKILRKFFQKLSTNFDEKEYIIDVSKVNTFCNTIKLNLRHTDEYNEASYIKMSDDVVYIDVDIIEHHQNYYNTSVCGLILHELLHAYEDKCKKETGKPSIFDEFTNKYQGGYENIKRQDFVIRNLAVLNYFLDKHEQRAYLSTIELDILEILKDIKPTFSDMRTNKVLTKLKETSIWKTYFNFGKFCLFIDKIDDDILEKSYYIASTPEIEKNKDLKDRIELIKQQKHNTSKNYKVIKSANDIRKECKNTWNKFQKKFNSVFIKVYNEVIN